MIHPSYVELMRVVNKDTEDLGEVPVVNSRYSIVIASAKRARQLIDGAEPKVETTGNRKALSIAVDELYNQKVHILGEDESEDTSDEGLEETYEEGSEETYEEGSEVTSEEGSEDTSEEELPEEEE